MSDATRARSVRAGYRFNNDLRYRDGVHPNQRQLTPPYVLDPVRDALGGIDLDPCTEPDNPTGARRFYTVDDDGLALPWHADDWMPTVYCNPPYGRAREPWVEACMAAGARGQRVVLLIPAHTDTRIFQRAMHTADAVVFIKGRVKFGVLRKNRRQEAASHPSALLGWNVDLSPCSKLGKVVHLTPAGHDAADEIERLRAALREIRALHQPEWASEQAKTAGKEPWVCALCGTADGLWPCATVATIREVLGDE